MAEDNLVEQDGLEPLLEYLRDRRGFDFAAYKRASLSRRLVKRMELVGARRFDEYQDLLEREPAEFRELFNTILINVTGFFRDPEVWAALATDVVPALLAARGPADPIRAWSAGCASGQEPYSIVMMLAEALGVEAVRDRVKIYATDLDEDALAEARRASFTEKQLADVPAPLVARYFERHRDDFVFHRELRRSVIFGRHDLLLDAPISRVDLLVCRNTLMYFTAEAQSHIMARFFFSVNPGGFLVLGRAEMLFKYAGMFAPVDLKHRVFKVTPKAAPRLRPLVNAGPGREDVMSPHPGLDRLRDVAFETGADAQIIVDAAGAVVAANNAARRLFTLADTVIGTPLKDLELSYRPAELRPGLDDVRRDRREVMLRNIPWVRDGQNRQVDVSLAPLFDGDLHLGTRVTFTDVTLLKALQDELTHSKQELETAYEELQSTNEELETTNEELQSTVEELETTNEELQSTNEELETMNEELQSTNEELQAMNDELRNRGTDLNASNAFLESVFSSLGSAVIVLDRDLRVEVWNTGATELWGLRADETRGMNFFTLDFGLPLAELHQPIRDVMHDADAIRELSTAAINRKGRTLDCRIRISPLRDAAAGTIGVILLMQDAKRAGDAA
jgi:two-component system CheB/CheR fusion protein